MPRTKFNYELVVEHEYREEEPSLDPDLATDSLKAESPSPEAIPARQTRPRKGSRRNAPSNEEQQVVSSARSNDLNLLSEQTSGLGRKRKITYRPDSLEIRGSQESAKTNTTKSSKRCRGSLPLSNRKTSTDIDTETVSPRQDAGSDDFLPSPRDADSSEMKAEEEHKTSRMKQKVSGVRSTNKAVILIGLDFGMTRSGIWWCLMRSGHIKSTQPFEGWSGTEQNATKIPTAIAYACNNPGVRDLRTGNDIDVDLEVSAWFKELLNCDQPDDEGLDDPLIRSAIGEGLSRLPPGITPETATKDFLKSMNDQFLGMLNGNYGQKFIDHSEFRYMLTHPAKWSESAKNHLRTAAMGAGLQNQLQGDVSFMTEPEAAMVAVLSEHQEEYGRNSIPFEKHNSVMIVDIGGSTVDTAVFYVKQLEPHLLVCQSCPPNSARCGFTTIDRKLHEMCELWFGDAFKSLSPIQKGPRSHFMRSFETIRTAFSDADEGRLYRVPLRMEGLSPVKEQIHYDFVHGHVLLKRDDMQWVFQPAIDMTYELVENTVKAVRQDKQKRPLPVTFILVGGGASCKYMRHSIETHFQSYPGIGQIHFMYPPRPLNAIAKGAALSTASRYIVMERLCVRSYGTKSCQKFDPELDDAEDAVYNAAGKKMVGDGCDWIISKGTAYTIKNPCKRSRELSVWVPKDSTVQSQRVKWPLIVYDGDGEPPKRFRSGEPLPTAGTSRTKHNANHRPPREIGQIQLDLTKAAKSGETVQDEDITHEKIVFEMVMKIDFKSGIIGVEAKQDARKIIGKQSIVFDG